MNNKLSTMIANGEISIEELAGATELIERAKLVTEGIEACKKTISFPFGSNEVNCYHYMDSAGEYESWGTCTTDGMFTCSCNWGGNHVTGRCNLTDYADVFKAFDNHEFEHDLRRFLQFQIKKATE